MIATPLGLKQIATAAAEEGGHAPYTSWTARRAAVADAAAVPASVPRDKGAVLLVESETIMRSALARALRQLGYRVLPAAGAVEAQCLAQRSGPIQLLFLNLSAHTDIELVKWFQAIHPETRIVLATDSLWDTSCDFVESPQMAYLAKPYTSSELASLLRQVLG